MNLKVEEFTVFICHFVISLEKLVKLNQAYFLYPSFLGVLGEPEAFKILISFPSVSGGLLNAFISMLLDPSRLNFISYLLVWNSVFYSSDSLSNFLFTTFVEIISRTHSYLFYSKEKSLALIICDFSHYLLFSEWSLLHLKNILSVPFLPWKLFLNISYL